MLRVFLLSGLLSLCNLALISGSDWDGPIYGVNNGKIIVNMYCDEDEELKWDNDLSEKLGGMKKSSKAWLLTDSGKKKVKFGSAKCHVGPCDTYYAAIELKPSKFRSGQIDTLVPTSFLKKSDVSPIKILEEDKSLQACREIYPHMKHDQLSETTSKRTCHTMNINKGNKLIIANTEFGKGNVQMTGVDYNGYIVIPINSPKLTPVFRITDKKEGERIIWRGQSGKCCPHTITHRVSTIEDGKIIFGKEHNAGMQFCL